MTPEEALRVRRAAQEAVDREDWQGAYDLLLPLHEAGVLTGTEQGDVAFLLGEACRGLNGFDAAHHYYDLAVAQAGGATRERAQARLRELGRLDAATEAAADGIDPDEAVAVLRGADDAFARGDYHDALAAYSQVYAAPQMPVASYGKATVGIAKCHEYLGDVEQAEQYATFATTLPDADAARQASEILERLRVREAATEAGADGATPAEFDEIFKGAGALYRSGQYDAAYALLHPAYESPQLPASLRGAFAYNLGMCCMSTQDYDAAHQFFTEATSLARAEVAQMATDRLAELTRMDDALEIVHNELVEH